MPDTRTKTISSAVEGYIFWYEAGRAFPYRWAAKAVAPSYKRRHGSHHGGAQSLEAAYVAAERHAMTVSTGLDFHE